MSAKFDFMIGITVSRGYGAAAYLVGYGPDFEKAHEESGSHDCLTSLSRSPEYFPGATEYQLGLGQIIRVGGFDSHSKASNYLKGLGATKVFCHKKT